MAEKDRPKAGLTRLIYINGLALCLVLAAVSLEAKEPSAAPTFCNPLDLSYRFQPDKPSRREAADPVVVLYRDEYYLFASMSGGYWHSPDLRQWSFIPISPDVLPIEDYAPAAVVIDDTLYFTASSPVNNRLYRSTDPLHGHWSVAGELFPVVDPDLFLDRDGRLYFYWGCSDRDPLYGVELDRANGFRPKGEPVALWHGDPSLRGWERTGDSHELPGPPWIEGSWMTCHDGRYYLQYAAPGTQYKTYGDGVLVADKPLGPFEYQLFNPFSYKPGGFICGAGHSNTFQDRYGNWWRAVTLTISVEHMFERRIGLYPAGFDREGVLFADTRFGDYPYYIPEGKLSPGDSPFTGWMLLSWKKPAQASSSAPGHPPALAFDEEVRSWWSAASGAPGEWLEVDLGASCRVEAVQVNFAEPGAQLFGRESRISQRYVLEGSDDGARWRTLADASRSESDHPHAWHPMEHLVRARYVRLRNTGTFPGGGAFAVRGLRVFGHGSVDTPAVVDSFSLTRDPADSRNATLIWPAAARAEGYLVQWGAEKDKLYGSMQVWGITELDARWLEKGQAYWFRVDSYNPAGVTEGTAVQELKAQ